jgi:alpha-L-fucosidase
MIRDVRMENEMSKRTHVDEWFSSRKLGLFLHFGLYSIEGWHEQDQMRRRIPRSVYEQLIQRFNPVDFDADAILDLAEHVGMKYVCLTTKHHDGFCLWNTKQTEFNVMQSPYGSDIVGQLADACHRRNFPLGLYYSVVDWHHPSYPNQGRHHELPGPEDGDEPDWYRYMDYLKAQIRELCTNYGEIAHFFWDMNVPEFTDPSINEMLRSLQPRMVINNRGFDEGDFGTPEREYQKSETDRTASFARPTEACNSVGTQSWGYRKDEDYYTSQFLMQSIDAMMAKGAHYLLNVGPDTKGGIPDAASELLEEIGEWYGRVREAFSGTTPCTELTTNQQVLLTRRESTVYVHLSMPVRADAVLLPPLYSLPSSATILNTGDRLECSLDVLPSYWKNGSKVLRIKGISRQLLARNEIVILKLVFEGASLNRLSDIDEFQG